MKEGLVSLEHFLPEEEGEREGQKHVRRRRGREKEGKKSGLPVLVGSDDRRLSVEKVDYD